MNHFSEILVVRSDDRFSDLLREGGCRVVNLEVIKSEPIERSELRRRLAEINRYDGLFFTSPTAARVFAEEGASAQKRFTGKIYVLGRRTKEVLEAARFEVVFREDANTAAELISSFVEEEFAGKKLLFLRGDRSMRTIPEMLGGEAEVDEVVLYRTKAVPLDERTLETLKNRFKHDEIDWTCFFSPSAVDAFLKYLPTKLVSNTKVAAIGSTTARCAEGAGLRVEYISERATAEDFSAGLLRRIQVHRPTASIER